MSAKICFALALALTVTACSRAPHPTAATGSDAAAEPGLTVSSHGCVGDWQPPAAGQRSFAVHNVDTQPLGVTLINADSGSVLAEVRQLDPGTTRPVAVNLPAGNYRWRCVPITGVAAVSTVGAVSGHASPGPVLVPLSAEEIDTAVSDYQSHVADGLRALENDTDHLAQAIDAGDLTRARALWLPAHLDYARLGAAYGTFGDLDDAIDGRPDGLPGGVNDPGFTGFLRVEHLLWGDSGAGGEPATAVRAAGDQLRRDVHRLTTQFGDTSAPAGQPNATIAADLPLRAHEILENTLQFELTGAADQGSHTTLATAEAEVEGTSTVLQVLAGPLQQRDPQLLADANAGLTDLTGQLNALRGPGGGWPAVAALPQPTRERLDGAVDGLLERLAPIPDELRLPPSLAQS